MVFFLTDGHPTKGVTDTKQVKTLEVLSTGGTGGPKDICMYWFAGLISSKWLPKHYDDIEYTSNDFQLKLNRNFVK